VLRERDFELIKRVSEGDQSAFKELYDETYKKVYFYLFRLFKEKSLVEDVIVETYTEVWINAKNFRGNAGLLTWIIGISRNIAMNKLKKLQSHESIDNFPDIPDKITSSETELNGNRELIQKAMMNLSLKHREVLDLVFFQEMTYKEVSLILKIPVNTVKTRVFYAKEELKKIISRMGVRKDEI